MDNNVLTALVLAALDDSAIKALNERVNELAELGFKPQIVTELPEEGNDHTLYLVLESEPGEDPWYQEYLWLDNEWEKIGTTSIDFEDYYTKDEADSIFVPQLSSTTGQSGSITNNNDGIVLSLDAENGGNTTENKVELTENSVVITAGGEHGGAQGDSFIQINGAGDPMIQIMSESEAAGGARVFLDAVGPNSGSTVEIYEDSIGLFTNNNSTSIEMSNDDETITLSANNGVKVSSAPVEDDDISTKGYVDTEISNLEQEISGDLSDLEQALNDEVGAREQAIQGEADARTQAIQDEAAARADDVAALQESIDELSGTLDDDIQELEDLIDTKADRDRFFDGRSEDWDEKTTEQKQDIWLGMVEDYVQLDIAETYDINSTLGLDPQEPIVSDLYEDEAIDLTNQIIGGSF